MSDLYSWVKSHSSSCRKRYDPLDHCSCKQIGRVKELNRLLKGMKEARELLRRIDWAGDVSMSISLTIEEWLKEHGDESADEK